MPSLVETLASTELFSGLAPDERQRIAEVGRVEYWQEGALVLEEGAFGPRMMVLLEGDVEILRRDRNGVLRAISTLGPGEVLGEMSLLLDLPRTASVRASTALKVFAMDRQAFTEMVDASDPAILKLGLELSRAMARRVIALNDRVMELLAANDEARGQFGEARQAAFRLWYDEPG